MSGLNGNGDLAMPFRPFTVGEVSNICGQPYFGVIDEFVKSGVVGEMKLGDDGTTRGFNIQQAFAIFCACRWLKEGCGEDRATKLAVFIAHSDVKVLKSEIDAGRTFPVLGLGGPQTGELLVAAPKGRIGSELNLAKLRLEFFDALYRAFPKKSTTPTN